jgi:hypothetical protein
MQCLRVGIVWALTRRGTFAMKSFSIISAVLVITASMSTESFSQDRAKAAVEPTEYKATIEGLVRDIACPMQNRKSTSTSFNRDCALACAKSGSPLAILTKEGYLYFPISDQMPDPSQREKLMPFVGKQVRATGVVYRLNGTRAIVISDLKEVQGVKVRHQNE